MQAADRRIADMPAGFDREEYAINGVETVVYSIGVGRPVVYWHGAGTFNGIEFARDWSRRFKVILPFHPGWGESGDSPAIGCMNDLLLHYLDLFAKLRLTQFDLVGISFGGWMAAEFAVAHPQMLRKLALIAPAGLADPQFPFPKMAEVPPGEFFSYLVHDLKVLRPLMPDGGADPVAFGARMARETQATARLAPAGPFNPRLEHWLHRATMPTLLVWPKLDRLLPVGLAGKWMRHLPNARLEVIENSGHLVLNESPRACKLIEEFLAS